MQPGGLGRRGRTTVVALLATTLSLAAACAPPPPASPSQLTAEPGPRCAPVLLVTARGSGDQPGSDEVRSLHAELSGRLAPGAVEHLELGDLDGDGAVDEGGYPAFGIGGIPSVDPSADASLGHSTLLGGFNASLRIGGDELVAVLDARGATCPGQRLVLAGYSMGAATVGGALRRLPDAVADRVDAIALFGDPTFRDGPWTRAPGAHFPTGVGFLGGRDPYVPATFADRTTSWCGFADAMCTGNPLLLLAEILPCELFTDPVSCERRHIDYPRWAVPAAMADAAATVAAHLS